MESFFFDLLHFLYFLSLGALVGGGIALGGAAAPVLFKELDRPRAGTLFGAILERWDNVAILSVILLVLTSVLLFLNFETADARVAARYGAVALAILATLYAAAWANPIARGLRAQTPYFDELPASDPSRIAFARYHARSRRAMTLALLAGLIALYLS